ncbi:MAG: glycosyltransferase [Lachnospiraceae bacterium]|nr:glycosyltransferase [Lachnospiraceae bacterium]
MIKYDDYKVDPMIPGKQDPTVSVCIPVYNVENYIRACLDSVITQTYARLQIIIVDDGSTDSTGKICDDYAGKDVRINVIHKKNGGIYTARNACLDAVKGDYISWVDGDDTMRPDMIETMLSALIKEDADISICRYRHVYDDYILDDSTSDAYVFSGMELMEQFLKEDEKIVIQNAVWNKLYKTELGEDLRFPAVWYEDMVYTLHLLGRSSKSVYLDRAYYDYKCDRAGSASNYGINSHTYTDLIPNFYDRSAYLEAAGRHDLALISDYMLYKRFLIFVTKVYRSNDPDKKEHLRILDDHIRKNAPKFKEVYSCSIANPNEYRKMKIYLKSPAAYHVAMKLNDDIIIPAKQRRMRLGL